MPLKKITDLTDIGTPASDDLLEIVDVSDTTDSPEGTSKKVLVSALGGGGGVTEFTELTDVPASYTGQGSKVVAVKVDESGLEFVAGGGSQDLQSVLDEGNTATNGTEILQLRPNLVGILSDGGDIGVTSINQEIGIYLGTADLGDGIEGYINIINSSNGAEIRIRASNITGERDVQFPDKDGTIAFLDDIPSGAVDSVNGQTGVVVLDSDDINEGTTNLYFTDTRALGAIPDATPTVKGIAKLYTSLGSNTDGAVDQNTVNSALQGFIPLSGTTVGNPVTGDIEINDTKKIFTETESGYFDIITDIDNNLETTINVRNSDNTTRSSLLLSGGGDSSLQSISTYNSSLVSSQDGVRLFSNNPNYKGIEGENDYSEIEPTNLNIYAQRQYVENGLALKANAPLIDTVSSSALTGVTTEGILKSYLIEAGTYSASEILNFANDLYKTGTAGTVTSRLYTNTTASLSGASLLAVNISTAGSRKVPLRRQLVLKGGTIETLATTATVPDDNVNSGTVATIVTFNPAVDNYFITTAQNANAGDSTIQNNFKIHF